jgi:hypothetical protein
VEHSILVISFAMRCTVPVPTPWSAATLCIPSLPLLNDLAHYVPIASDMSDLVERIEWLKANPAREKEIAADAQDYTKRRLTKKAAVEHWAMLLEMHKQAGGLLRPPRPALKSPGLPTQVALQVGGVSGWKLSRR